MIKRLLHQEVFVHIEKNRGKLSLKKPNLLHKFKRRTKELCKQEDKKETESKK